VPAIFVALFSIAWTPVAERYVYLPTAFFLLGCLLFIHRVAGRYRSTALLLLAVLIIPTTVVTAQRNIIWQDNEFLYTDSQQKSPDFVAMDNERAIALIAKGKYDEAEKVLIEGKENHPDFPLLYINHARIYLLRDDTAGARAEILKICQDLGRANLQALKMLAKIDEQISREGDQSVIPELVDIYSEIVRRGGDPYLAYRLAQLLLHDGKAGQALIFFSQAYERSGDEDFYHKAAGIMALKLSQDVE
jgi:Flp pilus assembly protein TadD